MQSKLSCRRGKLASACASRARRAPPRDASRKSRRFVALFIGSVAIGCGGKAPAPTECDQACMDGVALRAVRVAMRFAYNFALASKPVGAQNAMAPCLPTGTIHIVGTGQSDALLGTSTVNLTYAFADCVYPAPQNPAPERNFRLTLNGSVTENGTIAMGGPTSALVFGGTGIGISGTVFDPPMPYEAKDCVLEATQDGNSVTGLICGRTTDGFSGF